MSKFYPVKSLMLAFLAIIFAPGVRAQMTYYNWTGGAVTYVVPAGIASLSLDVVGARGGGSEYNNGGAGGRVQCNMLVTPGQVYLFYVGDVGSGTGSNSVTGTGGNGKYTGGNGSGEGGGGGGCSEVDAPGGGRLVVAGAGGGGSWDCTTDHGGLGGNAVGTNGLVCGSYNSSECGTGGNSTTLAGGTGASSGGGAGSYGNGGNGAGSTSWEGGGGAGYYGGGGGYSYGAGGGGSSWPTSTNAQVIYILESQGYNNSNSSSGTTGSYIGVMAICAPPVAGTLVGTTNVCIGQTGTMTDVGGSTGGVWSSSDTTKVKITTAGVMTGISAGAVTINYTINHGVCGTLSPGIGVAVNPSPNPISGSTNICTATTGSVSTSSTGGTWSSGNPTIANVDPVLGTVTGYTQGVANISYTFSTGCATSFQTSVNVSPNVYTVSGSGSYCAGSAAPHVMLNSSDALISYSLILSGSTIASMGGTGSYLDFGSQPTAGNYTVIATNTNGNCTMNMSGSATVTTNPVPAIDTITATSGTTYCAGASGVPIGLNNSQSGVNYQLYYGTAMDGAAVPGSTMPLNFGTVSGPGTYTVKATFPSTGCASNMWGSKVVSISPAPNMYTVSGGGNYCNGTSGSLIGLSGSQGGVIYRLFYGSMQVDTVLAESVSPFYFGNFTGIGTYSVVAINAATGCSLAMDGDALVGVSPLPATYSVTGGGNYCAGGTGVAIGMAYAALGTHYQLYNGITPIGSYIVGANAPITFGAITMAGAYTVEATNPITSCTNSMTGGANVVINSNPNVYNLAISGNNSYCSGAIDTGVVMMLSGADPTATYSLYQGSTLTSVITATSSAPLSFGYQRLAGAYHVTAEYGATGCSAVMTGSPVAVVNPLPTVFYIGGGGNYCQGSTGVPVTLSSSQTGVSYMTEINGTLAGAALSGSGTGISFTGETNAGVYTILATNTATNCTNTMSGSVAVTVEPSPSGYSVTGNGAFCFGGSGRAVGLASSDAGVTYQLEFDGGSTGSPMSGTGTTLNFGLVADTGTYTVVATNNVNHCSIQMPGQAVVSYNPLPNAYPITGGGSYCSGGAGVTIGLSNSTNGVVYRLYDDGTLLDTMSGSGRAISFGAQSAAGSYYIVGKNNATGCTNSMAGGATVTVNMLPTVYTVTGGGAFCANGTGVNVSLSGSTRGNIYQLLNGSLPTSTTVTGSGAGISFGLLNVAGPYTVIASDPATGCNANMAGTATISVNPLPSKYTISGGGAYCAGGSGVDLSLDGSDLGVSYQLNNGGPIGHPVTSSGGSFDFGMVTAAGSYSVVATNTVSGCVDTMYGMVPVVVNPLPATYMLTGGGTYCSDGFGVPVGLSNSDMGTSYQLYNGTTMVGIPWSGLGSALGFGMIGVPGTYSVIASNTTTHCSANMSGSVVVNMETTFTPSISAASGAVGNICAGTAVNFTSTGTGRGSTPAFQWSVNGMPISGAVSSSYNYDPSNGDNVTVTLTSSDACARPAAVTSAPVTMLVNPVGTPNVSISANTGNMVCNGTSVVFSANPEFGGLNPTYLWKKNGIPVGANATSYAVVPQSGDNIFCTMTTSYPCASLPMVYSNQIAMTVDTPQTPQVSVLAIPGASIIAGQSVTFAATAYNTGSNVSYQWSVNNNAVTGATDNSYTNANPNNGDVVSCWVTNSNICGQQSASGSVTLKVGSALSVSQLVSGVGEFTIIPNPNKGEFELKGTLTGTTAATISVEVVNMLGQNVYSGEINAQNNKVDAQLNLGDNLSNGMYILNVRSQNGSSAIHFVIDK